MELSRQAALRGKLKAVLSPNLLSFLVGQAEVDERLGLVGMLGAIGDSAGYTMACANPRGTRRPPRCRRSGRCQSCRQNRPRSRLWTHRRRRYQLCRPARPCRRSREHTRRRRPRCRCRGPRRPGPGWRTCRRERSWRRQWRSCVQIRDVVDDLDLGVGALGANDHKVVDEHILTGVGIDESGGLGVVHGALGGRDEYVNRGTGTHLLDKVAGALNCVSANVVPVWSV